MQAGLTMSSEDTDQVTAIGPERKTRSAYERLRELPAVMSSLHLVVGGEIDEKAASVMLNRWSRAGMIEPVGPRTGYYYNLVRDPAGAGRHLADALLAVHPSAVAIGATVLHDDGVTTQIPRVLQVAVPKARSHRQVDGVQLCDRPAAWYQAVRPFLRCSSGLPSLTPELAIADGYRHADSWRPDPDDIEIEMLDVDKLEAGLGALGMSREDLPDEFFGAPGRGWRR